MIRVEYLLGNWDVDCGRGGKGWEFVVMLGKIVDFSY